MNITQAIKLGQAKLSHLNQPRLEAELLLSHLIGRSRAQLKAHPQDCLKQSQAWRYDWWLHRRASGVPLAYLQGQVTWNQLTLKVNRHTLIPRDETEILCHHIKENYELRVTNDELKNTRHSTLDTQTSPQTILDIGTGSGCIAIWLAKTFPQAEITALDISTAALRVAAGNAKAHQACITYLQSDLLQAVAGRHFDLVVANLPYVPSHLPLSPEVQREPRSAIVSGSDGLDHIRRLAQQIKQKKVTFNQLWLEFLPQQQKHITQIFAGYAVNHFPNTCGEVYFTQIVDK